MAQIRDEFDRSMREYDAAHNLTPMTRGPSRLGQVRDRGRRLNAELERDGRPQEIGRAHV